MKYIKYSLYKYKNIVFAKLMKLLRDNTNINNKKKIYKALVFDIISYIYLINHLYRYITKLLYKEYEYFMDIFMKEYLKITLKEDYLKCNFLEEVSISLSIFYNLYDNY